MLYTIALVFFVLWFLGILTSNTLGGVVHVLLVMAVFLIVFNIVKGTRAL